MSGKGAIDRLNAALSDRYRIERQLGEGGMAAVYLAEDLKHKRRVALKVLKPELAAVIRAQLVRGAAAAGPELRTHRWPAARASGSVPPARPVCCAHE